MFVIFCCDVLRRIDWDVSASLAMFSRDSVGMEIGCWRGRVRSGLESSPTTNRSRSRRPNTNNIGKSILFFFIIISYMS